MSTRLPAEEIRRRLPSMYHQFKELADVDITAEPMEVGPTCHYVMGGVEVDPDTAATSGVPGLFAAGEVAGGMHGSNRLGGNSLSDLLVFGRRAGAGARRPYAPPLGGASGPTVGRRPTSSAAAAGGARPRSARRDAGENPYTLHQELQQTMNDLVGIIRREGEMEEALEPAGRAAASGPAGPASRGTGSSTRAGTSRSTCGTCCWSASASRGPRWSAQESRGGHTREDFPGMDRDWRRVNLLCRLPTRPTGRGSRR